MNRFVIIFLFTFALLSCKTEIEVEGKINENLFIQDSSVTYVNYDSENEFDTIYTPKPSDVDFENDCVRGLPEPVMDSSVNATFELKGHIGYERFQFGDSLEVEIENTGCEYYVLNFKLTTNQFENDISEVMFWYSRLEEYLILIGRYEDTPVGYKEGLAQLTLYLSSLDSTSPVLGKGIVYDESIIRRALIFEKINKKGSKTELIVSFSVGPL